MDKKKLENIRSILEQENVHAPANQRNSYSLAWELLEEVERLQPAVQISIDLASWSYRYPKGGIYPGSMKNQMDGELEDLERRSKAIHPRVKAVNNV